MVLTPFCDLTEWEEKVKKMSKEEVLQGKVEAATTATSVAAKTLCKPFDQPPLPEGNMCIYLNTIHTYIWKVAQCMWYSLRIIIIVSNRRHSLLCLWTSGENLVS